MDVLRIGGPSVQEGVGIVAPFDFALDRELWRWVPEDVSLHLTRTPFVPVEVSLDMARLVSEHETLRAGVLALSAVRPAAVAYACTSGSFVAGMLGERAMCDAMAGAGAPVAVTTSGAMLEALSTLGVRRISIVTPYTAAVTDSLAAYLAEGGVEAVGVEFLSLTRDIWRVPYQDVVAMVRRSITPASEAVFISCTNLPSYDVLSILERELGRPVLSANQVTVWCALRRIGKRAVGAGQSLLDLPLPTIPPTTIPQPTVVPLTISGGATTEPPLATGPDVTDLPPSTYAISN